jgi:hypothetical protein
MFTPNSNFSLRIYIIYIMVILSYSFEMEQLFSLPSRAEKVYFIGSYVAHVPMIPLSLEEMEFREFRFFD